MEYLFAFLKSHESEKTVVFLTTIEQVKFVYQVALALNLGARLFEFHGKLAYQDRMAAH